MWTRTLGSSRIVRRGRDVEEHRLRALLGFADDIQTRMASLSRAHGANGTSGYWTQGEHIRDGFLFEGLDNVTRGAAYNCVDGQAVFYRFVKDHKRLVISEENVRICR
jgi:hypothetical protein